MNSTKKEALRLHNLLWTEIPRITTPELLEELFERCNNSGDVEKEIKRIAIRNIGINEKIENECFCCLYDDKYDGCCKHCPVKWAKYNSCTYSEFGDWCYAIYEKDIEKANEIALRIANLPENFPAEIQFEVECFDRTLKIRVDDWNVKKAAEILEAEYERWLDLENNPELQFECCEEYMLSKLTEAGIGYMEMEKK